MSENSQPEQNKELEFSLDLERIPVKIKGKDKVVRNYTLQELDGKDRDVFLNTLGPRMNKDATGKPTFMRDFVGLQASLIAKCLLDDQDNKVPESTIQQWPAKVQASLFKEAQKMNGLEDKAEENAKND